MSLSFLLASAVPLSFLATALMILASILIYRVASVISALAGVTVFVCVSIVVIKIAVAVYPSPQLLQKMIDERSTATTIDSPDKMTGAAAVAGHAGIMVEER